MTTTARLARRRAVEVDRLRAAGVRSPHAAAVAAEAFVRQRSHLEQLAPVEHGSEPGYRQHLVDGDPPCAACRAAHSQHTLERRPA